MGCWPWMAQGAVPMGEMDGAPGRDGGATGFVVWEGRQGGIGGAVAWDVSMGREET
jgi:hypothetical protein